MVNVKLKSLILKEQIDITNVVSLENAAKAFAESLVKNNIVSSHHKDLTAADVQTSQYIEDMAEVVRNEIIHWVNTVNARGGR